MNNDYYYGKEELGGVTQPIFKRRRKPITDWETLEEEMRGVLDYNALSEDQREVFERVMKWYESRGELLTLGGYAGTGKSTLVSIIARELETAPSSVTCAYFLDRPSESNHAVTRFINVNGLSYSSTPRCLRSK